jgi:hypothetical protein
MGRASSLLLADAQWFLNAETPNQIALKRRPAPKILDSDRFKWCKIADPEGISGPLQLDGAEIFSNRSRLQVSIICNNRQPISVFELFEV